VIHTCTQACELPADWDDAIGDNLYLRRDFLEFMEACEACDQRYYYIRDGDGVMDTVFTTHLRRRFDVMMFRTANFRVDTTMVYIPASVSRPGIAAGRHLSQALDHIRSLPGLTLMLNFPDEHLPGFASGLTCPKHILTLNWDCFDDYIDQMRGGYRRRYRKALRDSAGLRLRTLDDPSEFDEELYGLYLQVLQRSRTIIETLSIEYFRGHFFTILVLEDDSGPQGFVQLLPNGTELIFEFVGVNYATNATHDTYHRLLLEIVKYGIEHGFSTIDFGQTADESKLKLGCQPVTLYAGLHHSNPVIMVGTRLLAPHLTYPVVTNNFRVFKEAVQ